jgi:hypothetical protein
MGPKCKTILQKKRQKNKAQNPAKSRGGGALERSRAEKPGKKKSSPSPPSFVPFPHLHHCHTARGGKKGTRVDVTFTNRAARCEKERRQGIALGVHA